ncbi:hypothetical protein CPC08DRAFT_123312 [Agrocybe pediades]|nr:hypothetical protein CPC08DRAFT_123312 [Agrocybe pediades]
MYTVSAVGSTIVLMALSVNKRVAQQNTLLREVWRSQLEIDFITDETVGDISLSLSFQAVGCDNERWNNKERDRQMQRKQDRRKKSNE